MSGGKPQRSRIVQKIGWMVFSITHGKSHAIAFAVAPRCLPYLAIASPFGRADDGTRVAPLNYYS
jgi:hypothetical protein